MKNHHPAAIRKKCSGSVTRLNQRETHVEKVLEGEDVVRVESPEGGAGGEEEAGAGGHGAVLVPHVADLL